MLKNRSQKILKESIKSFIKNGEKITSEKLSRDYDFGIKPAMIRWELHDLAENGYFSQAHISSGRVPSDKAYRFFVDNIFEEIQLEIFNCQEKDPATDCLLQLMTSAKKQFVKELSSAVKTLSFFYEPEVSQIYESGLNGLFENLGAITKEEIIDVVEDFELLSDRLEEKRSWWENEDSWPQVFIGKNYLTKSRHLSVIVGRLDQKNGARYIVTAVGPKRMDYEKSIRLFKSMNDLLKV